MPGGGPIGGGSTPPADVTREFNTALPMTKRYPACGFGLHAAHMHMLAQ